ncbi:MAG TPA: DUF3833 domain-containing protein [Desulfopila sp.]|nr:DUF3833 domain-containing protein [Desulfopila sp.]
MRVLLVTLSILFFSGCSTVDVTQYKNTTPRFDFFEYFHGETRGWGMVQNWRGMVTRSFVVDMVGSHTSDGEFLLEEDFYWSDGELEERTWKVASSEVHRFSGTAADVVGTAQGAAYGNALNWQYHMLVDVEGNKWKIHFDDWMFLQNDDILINKLQMSKFGIDVGEITIVFSKIHHREQMK